MKVLFLDIDGVLNSHRTAIAYHGRSHDPAAMRDRLDDVALALVRGIVTTAGAVVVLSSSWRKDEGWSNYGPLMDLPIVDRTPVLCGPRGAEIADWLARHPGIETWAIVDDDSDMLPEQLPRFVHTHHADGLSFANASRLAELLGISIYDVNQPGQRLPEPCKALDWSGTNP